MILGVYSTIHNYVREKCGSILPLTALMLPLIIGMTGVGVDVSMWMSNKRDLQSAADAAAIAAAWEVAYRYDEVDLADIDMTQDIDVAYTNYPEYAAYKEAMNNGFDAATGTLDITFGTNEDGLDEITVSITQQESLYFSAAIFNDNVYTGAAAATVVVMPTGDFCLLALDSIEDGAITQSGNVTVIAENCGIAVNSNSESALDLSGNVTVDIKDLHIVGDFDASGSVNLSYDTLETNASTVPDPYEDLEIPADYDSSVCDYNNYQTSSDATLDPGTYCGGIRISGTNDIVMNPGVYYMECGNFDVSGGGTIVGDGVSIILTCSNANNTGNFDVSGSKDVELHAPAPDEDMEGVLVYKDRNAPETAQCNKAVGTAGLILDGAVYIPSDCFRIGGDADMASPGADPCTRVIAKTIQLSGNPYLTNECDGSAAEDIGLYSIKLVL